MNWIKNPENLSTLSQEPHCGVCWLVICMTKACSPVACANKAFPFLEQN